MNSYTKQELKVISALEETFRDLSDLSRTFQEISSSLQNLIVRCSLFANSIRSSTYTQRRRNIGPISLFGGAPDRVLLLRHCREAQKQQRNLQVVFDALTRSRSIVLSLADDLSNLLNMIELDLHKVAINNDSALSDQATAEERMTRIRTERKRDALAKIKAELARDSACAVEVLFASSALAICLDVDIAENENDATNGRGNEDGLDQVSVTWIMSSSRRSNSSNSDSQEKMETLDQLLDEEVALCEKVNRTHYSCIDREILYYLTLH